MTKRSLRTLEAFLRLMQKYPQINCFPETPFLCVWYFWKRYQALALVMDEMKSFGLHCADILLAEKLFIQSCLARPVIILASTWKLSFITSASGMLYLIANVSWVCENYIFKNIVCLLSRKNVKRHNDFNAGSNKNPTIVIARPITVMKKIDI